MSTTAQVADCCFSACMARLGYADRKALLISLFHTMKTGRFILDRPSCKNHMFEMSESVSHFIDK
uniref:CSON014304 protein n=1 Tax=Culicoides sonorensis TaxID=179676 RepID=A0A336K6P9_CULSO